MLTSSLPTSLYFTNRDTHHPLYPVMSGAIRAASCGWGGETFNKACEVNGWRHDFVQWLPDGSSLEEIEIESQEVYDKLLKIVQSS